MSCLLELQGITKRFGDFEALRDISLEIQQGEFVALLGPSGCGKTTLLRLVAGFLSPEAGVVRIDGQDITGLAPYRRPLNTVFQNYALFPHLSVLENVAYGPRRKGTPRRKAFLEAEDTLSLVGLEGFSARLPRELSGGQQQRVALARAIVNKPKILLLDEPLSALDLKLRKRMQLELKQLQEKLGITFVFVTHDQEEAMSMADRIVVMNAGRIEQVGLGDEIYARPATRFVADFVGEVNLIDCVIEEGGNVRSDLDVPVNRSANTSPGPATAVIRPEHFKLQRPGEHVESGFVQFKGAIADVASVGSHSLVHVQVGSSRILVRRMGGRESWMAAGQEVGLTLDPAKVHFISGKS